MPDKSRVKPLPEYQYAVKVVCGEADPCRRPRGIVAPGEYFTAVNVHNPSRSETVPIRWKVAVGQPGVQPGPVSPFFAARLKPDEAVEIDCPDILRASEHRGRPLKGFVVIESARELDVVAVYTATRGGGVDALDIERVPARPYVACTDLRLQLNTGKTAWTVEQDPSSGTIEPRPAQVVANPHPAWGQIQGAQWITAASQPGGLGPFGRYCYGLRFCLCSGFEDPKLEVQLLADDVGELQLNGHMIGTGPPANFATPISLGTSDPAHFVAGENHLALYVDNSGGGPTGFSLAGTLTAGRGRCPSGDGTSGSPPYPGTA
jgi:hypothetical protein